jgi:tetratricopeptide (TPR) repeat protein
MNNNLGVLNRRLSNHAQAIEHFHAALTFFQNNNDTVAAAGVLTNMGAVSNDIGAYEKSLENYFAALKILEEFKEENSLAVTLVNIGGVLVDSKNIEQSIPYYNRALKLFEKLNDERNKATTLLSLGVAYKEGGLLDSAFHYFTKSELLFKQLNNQMGRADALNEIGQVFLVSKNYAAARIHFKKALSIASDIELHSVVANVYYQLAKLEFELSKLEKARLYASMSIDSSKKYDMLLLQKDAHGLLSSIYERMGEMSLSLYHHKQFFALNDSLYGSHRAHKFAEMEAVYRLEQNELTIERLQQENELKDVSLHNAELKILWQKAQTYIILGVLLFLTVIMYLLYRQFKLNRKTTSQLRLHNSEILQKNEEITTQKEEIETQRNVQELQQELLRDKSDQLE